MPGPRSSSVVLLRRPAAALAFLLVLAAREQRIAAAGSTDATTAPEPPTKPPRIAAPKRPIVSRVDTLDYASLPLMKDVAKAQCGDVGVSVTPVRQGAYATPMAPSWNIVEPSKDTSLRIARTHFSSGVVYSDPLRLAGVDVEWVVLDRGRASASAAPVSRCAATTEHREVGPASMSTVTAVAIVPNEVYAYRRCLSGCDQPLESEARAEEIAIVVSPALWVASSGWSSLDSSREKDSFERAFATVTPGGSATFVVALDATMPAPVWPLRARANAWMKSTDGPGADTLELDVVWPVGSVPEVTLFTGYIEGRPTEIAPG